MTEKKLMSVYLIHSLPLKMSAIQIFVGDKMACVSHLVGEDTIGWEKELQLDNEVRMMIYDTLFAYQLINRRMNWSRIYMNTKSIDITFQEHAIKRALEEYQEIRDISKCISSI